MFRILTLITCCGFVSVLWGAPARAAADYFPPPDENGGWRTSKTPADVQRLGGFDPAKLDDVFTFIQGSTKNGGLLVLRHGWLVYERYFGLGHREATPNLGSCGKSFTSIAIGILLAERPELFPDGLDQKVFTPKYFPPEAFPLSDPRKAEIKLGQLLAFSAGIRGNNPGYVNGQRVMLDPIGPDGWQSMVDAIAFGKKDGVTDKMPISTTTLWCEPGGGYSYASSSIHLASLILRHVTGVELQDYLASHLAPLGWGRWGYGYKWAKDITHTPGAGGIALRATDMVRFGYLLLNDGRWKDQQVIPADYVQKCRHASPYNPHFPYSLQFDVNTDGHIGGVPRDAFFKAGSGGHVLYVVPSLDLVVWKLGGRDAQYSERETGLKPHPDAVREAKSRGEWRETVAYEDAKLQTLQRVVAALTVGNR
jgi:CubicO group peptidase (beta-lactamase class C family)